MSLKPLSPRKVIRVLVALGLEAARQRGSHAVLKHPDGRIPVVPVHSGENIGIGLLLKIIKDAKVSKEEFLSLLK